MLCSRYGDGLRLLDGFIQMGRLGSFIDHFFEELAEDHAWKFWIHKETGMSWKDFRLSVLPQSIDLDKLKENSDDIEKTLMKGEIRLNGII